MKFFPFSSHQILRFILGTALVASSGSIQAVEGQPNILFILADDVSYRNISCYPGSYDFAKTPAIDQIASEG
ncbi:MAG: arylsulfatase, partial [Verrucomicrobiae bacterium]|nr:arylsulfatase [Verrucomicrobiae bacterium]